MEECCKYEPIIVNGKYVGGNIIYCRMHEAAPKMLQVVEGFLEEYEFWPEGDDVIVDLAREIVAELKAETPEMGSRA